MSKVKMIGSLFVVIACVNLGCDMPPPGEPGPAQPRVFQSEGDLLAFVASTARENNLGEVDIRRGAAGQIENVELRRRSAKEPDPNEAMMKLLKGEAGYFMVGDRRVGEPTSEVTTVQQGLSSSDPQCDRFHPEFCTANQSTTTNYNFYTAAKASSWVTSGQAGYLDWSCYDPTPCIVVTDTVEAEIGAQFFNTNNGVLQPGAFKIGSFSVESSGWNLFGPTKVAGVCAEHRVANINTGARTFARTAAGRTIDCI